MRLQNWVRSRSEDLVGVDIGSSAIKIAMLRNRNSDTPQLEILARQDLPPDAIVDGVIIAKLPVADALENLFSTWKIRNRKVATALSGHSVIVKKVTMPALTSEELNRSIEWEAEQHIPFEISDVKIDYQVLHEPPNGHHQEVLLVAAKKDKILDYTNVVSMAGRIPVIVDLDGFALQNIYELNYRPTPLEVTALVNLGAHVVTIHIMQGTKFLFTRDITLGGSAYTEAIQKEFEVSFEEAELYKRGEAVPNSLKARLAVVLDSVSDNLTREIAKTLEYFHSNEKRIAIQRILISGGGSRTPGFLNYLSSRLSLPVEPLNPLQQIQTDNFASELDPHLAGDFAVALGLALRGARDR